MRQPDPGLFGPDSVTWRIHGDPVLAVGGLRALLLQSLHPRAMAAVAAHSGFRSDPWGRLQRTAEYIGQISFGTTEEAHRAAARVRGIHRKLTGTDPDTAAPFRIDDPELLLWVHCCEVDSFLSTVRRAGLRMTDGDAEQYLGEQVLAATLVGLPADAVPASGADLADYFAGVRPRLRLTAQAREAARFVLLPPMPAWVQWLTPARPAWGGLAGLGFALLPRWARRFYKLPGLPTTDAGASAAIRTLRRSLLALPSSVREGPHQKAARERFAEPASA
ncbi:MAG: oxygenase MpaB family protein [Geodermatophilaceae bacterium]